MLKLGVQTRFKFIQNFAMAYTKCINPFVANAPFLYPLKTSENRTVNPPVDFSLIT